MLTHLTKERMGDRIPDRRRAASSTAGATYGGGIGQYLGYTSADLARLRDEGVM